MTVLSASEDTVRVMAAYQVLGGTATRDKAFSVPAALLADVDAHGSVRADVNALAEYFEGLLHRIVAPTEDDLDVEEGDLFDRSRLSIEQHVVLNNIESLHQANLKPQDVREAAKLLRVPVEVLSMHLATRAGEMELERTVALTPKKETCVAPRSAAQRNKATFQPTLNNRALSAIKETNESLAGMFEPREVAAG
jgi:hypothetical protein